MSASGVHSLGKWRGPCQCSDGCVTWRRGCVVLPARHHWSRRVRVGQAGSGVLQLVPAAALCMRVVRQACTAGGVRVLHLWVAVFLGHPTFCPVHGRHGRREWWTDCTAAVLHHGSWLGQFCWKGRWQQPGRLPVPLCMCCAMAGCQGSRAAHGSGAALRCHAVVLVHTKCRGRCFWRVAPCRGMQGHAQDSLHRELI
jgi:hypothetical protein